MDYNIEAVAKETILLFFIETTEPYLGNFNEIDLTKLSRWLSRIAKLDIYSMRTHLLMLYQSIKRGKLYPPYNENPGTSRLPRVKYRDSLINVFDPQLEKFLRSFIQDRSIATSNKIECESQNTTDNTFIPKEQYNGTINRPSRKDRFNIPVYQPTVKQPVRCEPYIANRTFTVRAQSQPRVPNGFECPSSMESRRSKSASRMTGQIDYCDPSICGEFPATEYETSNVPVTSTLSSNNFPHIPNFPISPIQPCSRQRVIQSQNEYEQFMSSTPRRLRSRIPRPTNHYTRDMCQSSKSGIPIKSTYSQRAETVESRFPPYCYNVRCS
ncbi:hypothetical protein PGB90_003365 [Kerria lacca]